ncbi:hypothetical protein OG241_08400 [Streptomyces sp. NBC_01390]|uniref:hypothetical protein n=1 Tax=unclassified Streptomyces TaxID=2593676 RepID=UPI003247CC6F
MLRIVGMEKITVRNLGKVWVRIRMWEDAVRSFRWDTDATSSGSPCLRKSERTSAWPQSTA